MEMQQQVHQPSTLPQQQAVHQQTIPVQKKSPTALLFALWFFTALLFTGLGAGGFWLLAQEEDAKTTAPEAEESSQVVEFENYRFTVAANWNVYREPMLSQKEEYDAMILFSSKPIEVSTHIFSDIRLFIYKGNQKNFLYPEMDDSDCRGDLQELEHQYFEAYKFHDSCIKVEPNLTKYILYDQKNDKTLYIEAYSSANWDSSEDLEVEVDTFANLIEPLQIPDSSEEVSSYEGWKSYDNTDLEVSFKYPASWGVETSTEGNPEVCENTTITVSNNGYSLEIYIPCSTGPDWCVFDDTDTDKLPQGADTTTNIFSDYIEIEGSQSTFRRAESTKGTFTICMKEESTDLFIPWNSPGYIEYHVPKENIDYAIIDTLDMILKSYGE